jgi:hypothetical protein
MASLCSEAPWCVPIFLRNLELGADQAAETIGNLE